MDNLNFVANTPATSPSDSPFADVPAPRLSISHLMLWTFCSAVHLTAYRAILSLQGGGPPGYANIQDASNAINGIVTGAVFAGTIVLVAACIRSGGPMVRQPGHWLLVVTALRSLLYLPMVTWILLMQGYSQIHQWNMLLYGAVMVVVPIGFGIATWHQRTIRWKILFALLAAAGATQCLAFVALSFNPMFVGVRPMAIRLLSLQSWFGFLLAGGVVATSIGERVMGLRRDWLHWTGVAAYAVGTLAGLVWTVGRWFIS